MLRNIKELEKKLQKVKGHIFYYFHDTDQYVENAVNYIVEGLEQDGHVFIAENSKLYPVIQKKLQLLLDEEQITRLYYTNNFDFYFSKGSFHPIKLIEHCKKNLDILLEKKVPIRTWGHVEWGKDQVLEKEIEIYEKVLDEMILLTGITAVCAYEASLVSESLKKKLLGFHEFFITDEVIKT